LGPFFTFGRFSVALPLGARFACEIALTPGFDHARKAETQTQDTAEMTFASFRNLTVAAALALAAPAIAQETTTTEDTTTDMGEPVVADGPQPGQQYIRETFGDWALRCLRVEEGPEPCQLYQLLLNEEDSPLVEVLIIPLPSGGEAVAGATVVVPLETQLTEQLVLTIDGSDARRYPFDFCTQAGCVARFGMSQGQIDQFKAGASGTLTIVPAAAPDQEVVLTMSLSGFTAGFEATTTPPEN